MATSSSTTASAGSSSGAAIVGKRFGSCIRLRSEKYDEYKALHAACWPGVLARIHEANIRDYTIYYSKELGVLFSHFVWIGEDWDGDMAKISSDPTTREWWSLCDPCQECVASDGASSSVNASETGKPWWAPMEEMFHTD